MAIVYHGQVRAQGAATWGTLFSARSLTSYTWALAALAAGAYEVQLQAEDTSDGALSAWSATRTITVDHTPAGLVVTEGEISVNGGAYTPLFTRLAETRMTLDLSPYADGDVLRVRLYGVDLADNAASAYSAVRTITVQRHPAALFTTAPSLGTFRGLSAAEKAVHASQDRATHVWVEVKDEDGAWRDVSALAGEDYVQAVRVTESADANVVAADFTFLRETRRTSGVVDSLAPLMTGSALNVRSSNGTYAPFVQKGREIRVRAAVVARGAAVVEGDKIGIFHGYLDDPDWGNGVSVPARDLGSRLLDTIVEVSKTYGSESGTAVADVMRQILGDNGLGSVTLCVVGSPNWFVRPYELAAGTTVFAALESLAAQFGWLVRYRWTSRLVSQLCLYEPSRAAVTGATPAFTFSPSRYLGVSSFATESDGIRNIVQLAWRDAATGETRTLPAPVRDEDSIARYGPRYMQVAFDATSNIDTEAEAETLAALALTDLSQPYLRATATYRLLPAVGRDDVLEFAPNGVHHDTAQRGAVVALTHEIAWQGAGVTATTAVTIRGRPLGAYWQYLRRQAPPAPALGPVTLRARSQMVAADDTTWTVRLYGEALRGGFPTGQVPSVRVTQVYDGTQILAGPAIGALAPGGTLVTFARPAGAVPGSFAFEAILPDGTTEPNRDPVPQIGVSIDGLATLVWTEFDPLPEAEQPDPATVTRYRGTVSDPLGAATGDVTVTLTRTGADDTVTPLGPLAGPLPFTFEFDAPRQAFQSGESMVQAYAAAPGVQGEWERVAVAALERDTVTLPIRYTIDLRTATMQRATVIAYAPNGAVAPDLVYEAIGTSLTQVSETITGTEIARVYDMTRPADGAGAGSVTVRPILAGAESPGITIPVPEQLPAAVAPPIMPMANVFLSYPNDTTGRMTVTFDDPDGRVTAREYRVQNSDGTWPAGYSALAYVGNGGVGMEHITFYQADAPLPAGKTITFELRYAFTNADGQTAEAKAPFSITSKLPAPEYTGSTESIPASRVTGGTFGAGNFAFPGTVQAAGTISAPSLLIGGNPLAGQILSTSAPSGTAAEGTVWRQISS